MSSVISRIGGYLRRIGRWAEAALSLLFEPPGTGRTWVWIVTVAVMYLAGLVVWAYVLDAGRIPFGLHDWAEGTAHRLAFLQNAVREGRLPLHMPDGSALRNVTDRFISIPDTILSPQILLLGILSLGQFVLANTLLLFTAGFVGLVIVARRLHLSPFSFTIVFLLFSFNGHIADHIVVGNMHWAGYFLLSFYALLIWDCVQGAPGWRWVLGFSLLSLFVFLQGAYHLFVMGLMFLGLLAIGEKRLRVPALKAGVASLLLSMGRLLPPALEAGKFDSEFLSGFLSVRQLIDSMVELRVPTPAQVFDTNPLLPLGWWEIDHYLGLLGLAFIAVFGIVLARRAGVLDRTLAVPIFGMALLSIGRIYKPLNLLGIPLISSQRVATRFVIYSIVMLIVLGARTLERYLRDSRPSSAGRVGFVALLVLLGHDLWQHVKLWRIAHMYDLFPLRDVDLSGEYVANHVDPAYTTVLVLGWSVALVTVLILTYAAMREKHQTSR